MPKSRKRSKKFTPKLLLNAVFYGAIFLASALLLVLALYVALLVDSNISTLVFETSNRPFYFWPYVGLTLGTVILFGANVALLLFRLRRYGLPKFLKQSPTAPAGALAIFASACPVCGSTLLSAVGIAGGLSSLPFGGLELKTASLGFMALPVFLTVRDIKNKGCEKGVCPVPKNASFSWGEGIWLINLFLAIVLFGALFWRMARFEPLVVNALAARGYSNLVEVANYQAVTKNIRQELFPEGGMKTSVVVGDTLAQMVDLGIIDVSKLEKQYESRGGIPDDIRKLLTQGSWEPLVVTGDNQFFLVTFLWPLGLANKMDVNNQSPIAGPKLFNFASTGGWRLGRENNGGAYFNKYDLIPLDESEQARVKGIAEGVYRPCCGNSAFFQDCNHGSAAMAIIELGVAQGQSDEEIYKNVLAFNSYWFSQSYLETALYFKVVKHQDFDDVDPKVILSADYSSGTGWAKNVHSQVARIPGLVPKEGHGGSGCGV